MQSDATTIKIGSAVSQTRECSDEYGLVPEMGVCQHNYSRTNGIARCRIGTTAHRRSDALKVQLRPAVEQGWPIEVLGEFAGSRGFVHGARSKQRKGTFRRSAWAGAVFGKVSEAVNTSAQHRNVGRNRRVDLGVGRPIASSDA
jgi:hypothetical protein